ncbi:MAG: Dyp-type peroxidase [Phototrophicaceae bacterium]|jgi:Dyp-type peroxidase family
MLPDNQLRDIQGLVSSGYDYTRQATYFFLQFKDATQSRAWLKGIVPQITTSAPWERDAEGNLERPQIVLHLGFTFRGLEAFQLPEVTLLSAPREFIDGMANRAKILGDTGTSAPDTWEIGGSTTPEVHAILMLHATDATYDSALKAQRDAIAATNGAVVIIHEEYAFREASGREPFGFSDGVSQPVIKGLAFTSKPVVNGNIVNTGEFVLGYLNEYNAYSPTMVVPLADDPQNILPGFPNPDAPGFHDFGMNGTYLVYRKLQQDVAAFWNLLESHTYAPTPQGKKAEMLFLAAKMMGRWPSGAPTVLSPDKDDHSLAQADDFLYEQLDPEGMRCPIGSHARRANPRDSIQNAQWGDSIHSSNTRRILRRARLFGQSLFPQEAIFDDQDVRPQGLKDDGVSRGIHFFAINTEIDRQFEFIQKIWINNAQFNNLYNNRDAIVGNNDDNDGVMTIPQNPVRQEITGVGRFVNVRGGAYFFMPSIRAMRFMSE